MIASPDTITNAFTSSGLDETTELKALAQALELADGFKLIFVRCNQPQQRQRLIAEVQSKLPKLKIKELHFNKSISHLLDELRQELSESSPDAVFVSGLENSMSPAAESTTTPLIVNLNSARNSFPFELHCPLALWLPEYALMAIARGAPDFFSIRSGTYFFSNQRGVIDNLLRPLIAGDEWLIASLPKSEKQERINYLEDLLSDYERLSPESRDYKIEMRLHWRLGNLLLYQHRYDKACQHYKEIIKLAQQNLDRQWEGLALTGFGGVYIKKAEWRDAYSAFQESLSIFRETDYPEGVAYSLHHLASIDASMGNYSAAKQKLLQEIELNKKLDNKMFEAGSLRELASIDLELGDYESGREKLLQALDIQRQLGEKTGEADTLYQLGSIDIEEEKYAAGQEHLLTALAIQEQLGDQLGEANSWHQLASIDMELGDYQAAREKCQKALAIAEQLGDSISEAAVLHQLATIDVELGEYSIAQKKFLRALEINRRIDNPIGQAATLTQLGQLLGLMNKTTGGATLLMLAYLISSRKPHHPNAKKIESSLQQISSKLNYSSEQWKVLAKKVKEAHDLDGGGALVASTIPEIETQPFS